MVTVVFPKPGLLTPLRWVAAMTVASVIAGADLLEASYSGEGLAQSLGGSLMWVLQTPLQMWVLSLMHDIAQRRRIGSQRMLVEGLLCSVLVAVAFLLSLAFVIQDVLAIEPPERWSVSLIVKVSVAIGPIMAGIWATAFVYPHWAEQSAQRGAETERLKIEAEHLRATAELAHLRSQVEPHFLLNTLNMIAGLITQDPKEARRLIGCLGDLLRNSLHDADETQSLASEVVWLERYAEILESRHGNALRFSWDIAPEALAWPLPRLLLQPLVENAVRHGALCRQSGGLVTLSARIDQTSSGGERLVCTVSDNGPGLSAAPSRQGGVGLRSVRRRLQLEYDGAELRMRSSEEGTQAIVEVPATRGTQPAPPAADARPRAVAS